MPQNRSFVSPSREISTIEGEPKNMSFYSRRYEYLGQAHIRELILWAHLRHPNILPFYGVYLVSNERICIASPWMEKGDLSHHLENDPTTPRNPLVCNHLSGRFRRLQ